MNHRHDRAVTQKPVLVQRVKKLNFQCLFLPSAGRLASLLLVSGTIASLPVSANAQPPQGAQVSGFGGFFFRAEDPSALASWYEKYLGIAKTPTSYEQEPWMQAAGPTVFAPFPRDSEAIGPIDKPFVLNFRTGDLDALVDYLRSNEIDVTVDPETYPNGRFAQTKDPEGNPIQLWEPATPGKE